MKALLTELVRDESGLILSAELVLILTICVIGIIVGLVQVQTAVVSEFQDLALAFSSLNQSYQTASFFGCRKWRFGAISFTAGSGFIDIFDGCIGSSWGGGFAGGAFGGGYGGGGGVGLGGYAGGGSYGGGYSEIGGTGYCPTQAVTPPANVPCETCPQGTSTTTGTMPTLEVPASPSSQTPTPLPPPPVPTKD
jgi:Flp pilus assembly pilin Flp